MSDVWYSWNTTTGSATTTIVDSGEAWTYWCEEPTGTTIGCTVWAQWCNTTSTAAATTTTERRYYVAPHQPSAEERALWEEQRRQMEESMRVEREKREAADARARELLLAVLQREQREQFERDGHFLVTGRSGRRYRLRRGTVANIDVIERDGRVKHRLCAHPLAVPAHDTLVAQKLWLENDDEAFARVANVHPYTGGPAPVAPALLQ